MDPLAPLTAYGVVKSWTRQGEVNADFEVTLGVDYSDEGKATMAGRAFRK